MKVVLPRPPLVLAPVAGSRHFGHGLLLAMAAVTWSFGYWAVAKPLAQWRWVDILSESLIVAMLALWLVQLRASRPAGRVTTWLCLGLAGMLLGGWADLMDEFWKFPRAFTLLMGMESTCHVVGMTGLTFGLHLWRQEQLALNALRAGRERGYREHAQIDGLTQLGDGAWAAPSADLIGDGLYGVDVKQSGDKFYIIEVNDNPNIDAGIEDAILREELYRRIMGVFLARVQQRKSGVPLP